MRMVPISELIAELQTIHARFGNTGCWVTGLAWGSVALWQESYANDGETPLSPDWMWQQGWRFKEPTRWHWRHPEIPIALWDDRENELMLSSTDGAVFTLIKRGAVRRQVRLLQELLGIEQE